MCKVKFELKQEHIDLISELNFKGIVSTEGSEIEYRPAIDYKRPFGNSGVTYDVLQMLGLTDDDGNYTDVDRKRAEQLIIELPVALEIIVQNRTFEPGEYEVDRYSAYYSYIGQRNLHFWREAIKKFREIHGDEEHLVSLCMNFCDDNPYRLLEDLKEWSLDLDYMRKAVDVFEQYAIEKWIEDHDIDDYCHYCVDNEECPHGMVCYGGQPIEPACTGGLEALLDTESILEDLIKAEEQ